MLALASRPVVKHARSSSAVAASGRVSRPAAVARAAARGSVVARLQSAAAPASATKKDAIVVDETPSSSSFETFAFKASLAVLAAAPTSLLALASHAEDVAGEAGAGGGGGFSASPLEIGIALAPLLFYGLLTVYRNAVNPKATIGDGLFIVAALVIVANIVSILVFKTRLY